MNKHSLCGLSSAFGLESFRFDLDFCVQAGLEVFLFQAKGVLAFLFKSCFMFLERLFSFGLVCGKLCMQEGKGVNPFVLCVFCLHECFLSFLSFGLVHLMSS